MLTGTHQGQFDLVLDVFDVHRATAGEVAGDGLGDLLGQVADLFVHAGAGGCATAFDSEKGLGHGHFDLAGIKRRDLAVATDDLVTARRGGGQFWLVAVGIAHCGWRARRFVLEVAGLCLHGVSLWSCGRDRPVVPRRG